MNNLDEAVKKADKDHKEEGCKHCEELGKLMDSSIEFKAILQMWSDVITDMITIEGRYVTTCMVIKMGVIIGYKLKEVELGQGDTIQ